MADAAGYVLKVPYDRREPLLEAHEDGRYIGEPVSSFSHSNTAPLIAFVNFDGGGISHLAEAHKGRSAGTDLVTLVLEKLTRLETTIPFHELLDQLPKALRKAATSRFENGGLLPPATFEAIVDIIRRSAPESRGLLDVFSSERRRALARLTSRARYVLAQQKETVATALHLAEMDRKPLMSWTPPPHIAPAEMSFLDGLSQVRLREDAMIVSDLAEVPGFRPIARRRFASVMFEDEFTRLSVIMANGLELEEQLGADLIYYNHTFRSFVVVQYKAMEQRGKEGEPHFRLPDEQLTEEVRRMDAVLAELRNCTGNSDRTGFRLNENPFFLKLCPRIVFNPDDGGLIPGMYLPLDYWRHLEADETLVGKRGGRIITYKNVSRYLDNDGFMALVARAWIGTTHQQSAILEPLIETILASGRSVTLAAKTDLVAYPGHKPWRRSVTRPAES